MAPNSGIRELQQHTERCFQIAIKRIRNGEKLRAVAKDLGIPRSTLQDRLNGRVPRHEAAKVRLRLSAKAEALMIDWILMEEAAGRAPSLTRIAEVTELLLKEGGSNKVVGKNWPQRFVERHGELLKIKRGRLVDIERIMALDHNKLAPFYVRLEGLIKSLDLSPFNIWNMDETGTQEGDTTGGRVVGNRKKRGAQIAKNSNTAWVSTIECISAVGTAIPPTVVFAGKSLQSNWMTKKMPDWYYQVTPSGWTNTEIAFNWLLKVFLPSTTPKDSAWRLLILDGFATHIDHQFQLTAFRNRVQLLYLPAHSSHGLQPLDVAVFSPLKYAYRSLIRASTIMTLSAPASKQRFITTYEKARSIAMTPRNIRSGFRATGIWPYNPTIKMETADRIEFENYRPSTPIQTAFVAANAIKPLLSTPLARHDMSDILQKIQTPRTHKDRNKRLLTRCIKRGFEQKVAEIGLLRAKCQQLEAQIDAIQAKRGKRVKINPNERFANVEAFEAARIEQEAAEALAEQRAKHIITKYDLDAEETAAQIQSMKLEDMMVNWQLE